MLINGRVYILTDDIVCFNPYEYKYSLALLNRGDKVIYISDGYLLYDGVMYTSVSDAYACKLQLV